MFDISKHRTLPAIAALFFLFAVISGCQDSLLFRTPIAPVQFAGMPGISAIEVRTPDKELLNGWYAPPAPGRPLVLFFHGNKGREKGHRDLLNQLHAEGYGVLLASFRGYAPSTGQPSETGLYADGLALFDFAKSSCGCDIIILGHSLGSGVAVRTAALRKARAIILISPYSSIGDVAAYRLRNLPSQRAGQFQFNAMQWIKQVDEPLLVLHGEADKTIPIQFAEKLFGNANEPKQFKSFATIGHHLLWQIDLVHWLRKLMNLQDR